jgi:hypothetical protein
MSYARYRFKAGPWCEERQAGNHGGGFLMFGFSLESRPAGWVLGSLKGHRQKLFDKKHNGACFAGGEALNVF